MTQDDWHVCSKRVIKIKRTLCLEGRKIVEGVGAGMESQILGVDEAPSPELWQHARSQARAHKNLDNLQPVSLPPALFLLLSCYSSGCNSIVTCLGCLSYHFYLFFLYCAYSGNEIVYFFHSIHHSLKLLYLFTCLLFAYLL